MTFRTYAGAALALTVLLVGLGVYLMGSAVLPQLRRWYEDALLRGAARHEADQPHPPSQER